MQIDQENKHTMSLPHLSGPEKDAIMREKYLASMKPVSIPSYKLLHCTVVGGPFLALYM